MKKTVFLLSVISLIFSSCMNNNLKLSTVQEDPITGELSNYFEMSSQPVEINKEKGTFNLELECTKPIPKEADIRIGYILMDDSGNVIMRVKSAVKPVDSESMTQLVDAKVGDEVTISLRLPDNSESGNDISKARFVRLETKIKGDGLHVPNSNSVAGATKNKARLANVGFTHDYSDYVCYTRLTDDDLRYLSPSELRILRNTIYARHGRKFKSADLHNYFSGFSWYTPLYNEIDPYQLTDIEKHNIQLIQKYE